MDRPTKIKVIKKNDGYEIICMDEISGSSIGVDLPINGYKALAEHFRTGAMEISSDELGNCNKPHVNGSAFDGDEIYYTECPNCGRSYDEIDADYCICSKCGWDANDHKFNIGSKRNPTESDYLNGDADILTGEWS